MSSEAGGQDHTDERMNPDRTGEDIRRRGWFWHWNTIVTQFAPLIGLKGVGLLNSYTVWTDRREDSPHRGFAFPSQQSEANFYGEDRAELITINKILVALDLIEIRKQMVPHTDAKGRRWKVPHNLYRVKEHPNGFVLTIEDVLRVVHLAEKHVPVYRYIRRIFSENFAPIGRDNIWQQLLPALRTDPAWQKLASKAAREDARASARTKAGHASRARKKDEKISEHDDSSNAQTADDSFAQSGEVETSVANSNEGQLTNVPEVNNGPGDNVESANNGLTQNRPTIDQSTNQGESSFVARDNTIYKQDFINTTTTTTKREEVDDAISENTAFTGFPPSHVPGNGPVAVPSASMLATFEAANGRAITRLEEELLTELEREFHDAAMATGTAAGEWISEAIREAVNSGSSFVAPKRIREILNRWSSSKARSVRSRSTRDADRSELTPWLDNAPVIQLPHGSNSVETWCYVLGLLSRSVGAEEFQRLFKNSWIATYSAGTLTVHVENDEQKQRLCGEYFELVNRKVTEALRRTVRLRFQTEIATDDNQSTPPDDEPVEQSSPPNSHAPGAPAPPPRFTVAPGIDNFQLWAAVENDLRSHVSQANIETWIRPSSLLAIEIDNQYEGDGDAVLVTVGVPSNFAQQRLSGRLRPEIERSLSGITGVPARIAVVLLRQWMQQYEAEHGGLAPEESPDK